MGEKVSPSNKNNQQSGQQNHEIRLTPVMLWALHLYDGMNETAEVLEYISSQRSNSETPIETWPQMAHLHHVDKMIKM